jgi:putative ABC transport system permease protein
MVGLFSVASLLLAFIGLYGVVSYSTAVRLREFGIRMALGTTAGHVLALVLRHAGKLALWSSAIGLTFLWPFSYVLRSMLFCVTSGDLISWSLSPAILVSVALRGDWSCSQGHRPIPPLLSARSSNRVADEVATGYCSHRSRLRG